VITVSINNEKKIFVDAITIEQLLLECGFEKEKIAVAINTEFVPRSEYTMHKIQNGDKVDVLAPIQGG
jgi:sulfur carrier protein